MKLPSRHGFVCLTGIHKYKYDFRESQRPADATSPTGDVAGKRGGKIYKILV